MYGSENYVNRLPLVRKVLEADAEVTVLKTFPEDEFYAKWEEKICEKQLTLL